MRQALGLVAGGGVAVLAALILGEYQLGVVAGLAAGVIVGFAVAEAAAFVAGEPGRPAAAVLAAFAAVALVWAGWIDVRRRDEAIAASAWLGAVVAAATVVVRTAVGSGRSAGSGNPPDR